MRQWYSIIAIVVLSVGCSSGYGFRISDRNGISDKQALELIGKDLAFVMEQLLEPRKTTLQYGPTDSYFEEMICADFHKRGYGLQKVSADQGANFLFHETKVSKTVNGKNEYLYKVAIGQVSVERSYVDRGRSGIYPVSSLLVRGSSRLAVPDLTLFPVSENNANELMRVNYQNVEVESLSVPKITYITPELVSNLVTGDDLLPEETALNSSNLQINNLFFTNESNFSDMTRSYDVVRRDIIVFANDSVRLGTNGKRKVRNIYKTYNKKTDVISLLGCSNGHTDLTIGNQGLALGRSKRVLEEFSAIGVSKSALLDEGCWSPDRLDGRFPRRGVVVELKRRRS